MIETKEDNHDKDNEIELESDRAIVYFPHNAIEVEIVAKVYVGGDTIQTVSLKMDMDDVKEAVRKAAEGYIDEDDTFVVTDKGRAYLESLMKE